MCFELSIQGFVFLYFRYCKLNYIFTCFPSFFLFGWVVQYFIVNHFCSSLSFDSFLILFFTICPSLCFEHAEFSHNCHTYDNFYICIYFFFCVHPKRLEVIWPQFIFFILALTVHLLCLLLKLPFYSKLVLSEYY